MRVLRGLRGLAAVRRIILVRHTRPALAPTVCYGRKDIDLAPTGEADVRECLQRIPTAMTILCSPALRCRRLARALAQRDGLEVQIDERLLELDFGLWEGVAWQDIARDSIDQWAANLMDYRPGGGESLRMLWFRIQRLREERLERTRGTLVIVSHHGPIRALLALAAGRGPQDMFAVQIPYGAVQCLPPTPDPPTVDPPTSAVNNIDRVSEG